MRLEILGMMEEEDTQNEIPFTPKSLISVHGPEGKKEGGEKGGEKKGRKRKGKSPYRGPLVRKAVPVGIDPFQISVS